MSLGLPKLIERYVQPEPNSGCWIWLGALADGYGNTGVGGKYRGAHRAVYEYVKGPIPEGLQIDHLCRMRCCVNPDHLEAVTQGVNFDRGLVANRTHCKHGHKFDVANTIHRNGRRYCRACMNRHARAWQKLNKPWRRK